MKLILLTSLLIVLSSHAQTKQKITTQEVSYSSDGTTLKGYLAYNGSKKGKRPAVIVVHEWWGNTEYVRKRARQLAELGYIAFAVDMYGDGKTATDPKQAEDYAGPFYQHPELGKARIQAAVDKIKEYPQTDDQRIAAIGYCFGGSMVLNAAKMGVDFRGVVSFHGGLAGVPAAPGSVKGKILVCHGGDDKFVTAADIKHFRSNLDSVHAPYQFKVYKGATHAFSNPEATALGKKFNLPIAYNAAADKQSWQDMKVFFRTLF
ncbi:MAG: dienelactone hydrolase family protein [Sediminibacterium sp.]